MLNTSNISEDDETLDGEEPAHFDITTYPADTSLSGYKDMWNNDQFIIPEFQREYVWESKRASKLIESFLLGLPVPQVFLYKSRTGTKSYQIIDGLQRITTITSFLNGKYPFNTNNKTFTLKGVRKCWEGLSFDDLSDDDKFKLETSIMRSSIIQQHNPNDTTGIYQIFERLNTGGVPLNTMQVRMCIAESNFTRFLKKMNENPLWRDLIGMPEKDKKIKDMEILLRFFAFAEDAHNYKAPMKRFLTNYIEKKRKISDDDLIEKENLFHNILAQAKSLADRPFFTEGSHNINTPLMDAIVYAFSQNSNNQIITPEKYNCLLNNPDFINAIGLKNTSDTKQLDARLQLAKKILID